MVGHVTEQRYKKNKTIENISSFGFNGFMHISSFLFFVCWLLLFVCFFSKLVSQSFFSIRLCVCVCECVFFLERNCLSRLLHTDKSPGYVIGTQITP